MTACSVNHGLFLISDSSRRVMYIRVGMLLSLTGPSLNRVCSFDNSSFDIWIGLATFSFVPSVVFYDL
jgi:hypothetical protein